MPLTSAGNTVAATSSVAAPPTRRLLLLPREPRRATGAGSGPRRHRLARVEDSEVARLERFAHLKRCYD